MVNNYLKIHTGTLRSHFFPFNDESTKSFCNALAAASSHTGATAVSAWRRFGLLPPSIDVIGETPFTEPAFISTPGSNGVA